MAKKHLRKSLWTLYALKLDPSSFSLAFSWRHHFADFLESFRFLLRVGETVWLSPDEPERVSRRSFSTSAAISAMRTCAQRSLRSAAAAAAGFASFAFLTIAHNCVLFKVFSRWTFLTMPWIFLSFSWVWRAISRNRFAREWTGWGKKDKRQTGYADPGGRWRRGPKAKSSGNGRLFNLYFIHETSQCDVA
jgi:hypothetical protein